MAVDLPEELRQAVELRLRELPPAELASLSAALSARYRSPAERGAPTARSRGQVLGYAAFRLPATYAAVTAALEQLRRLRPDWRPRTLLDLGAGPGAGLWAAVGVFDSIELATELDAEPEMLALGRELAAAARQTAIRRATWLSGDVTAPLPGGASDLVLLSYVLTELSAAAVDAVVDRAWAATAGQLVVVEPGTPAGFGRVLRVRDRLVASGGFTTAPCPHDAACPMAGSDWCHFAVRLPRSRTHRAVKQAELGYEDEKFSYVALSRAPTERAPSRVLRHPQIRPGHIRLELCTPTGLRAAIVTRRDRDAFRRARKTAWGDGFVPSPSGRGPA